MRWKRVRPGVSVLLLWIAAAPIDAQPVAAQARGGGNGPADRLLVDPAAADRGRSLYATECVTCHGPTARGADGGTNIVRSEVVIRNRNGDTLGPFLKKGHTIQSGKPSSALTEAQVLDLSHFLRQQFNNTLRGSPLFEPGNILVGDSTAGASFFAGGGRCTTCHAVTGDLAGIGKKYDPVTLQQRMVFPMVAAGRGRGAASTPGATSVAITLPSGTKMTGASLEMDDFTVTFRDPDGVRRTLRRVPGLVVETRSRFAAHIALLDALTDQQMHDLVAYLETLK